MDWETTAATILAAATDAGVPVERSLIAPGPAFARDCRLLAVWLSDVQIVPTFPTEFAGMICAFATQLVYQLTFVADCVPASDDDGAPPPADEITTWSKRFLSDVQAIHEALATLVTSGDIGSCDSVQLGNGTPAGPEGRIAQVTFPVTVLIGS